MTSALPPDPWKALGIERSADKSEIRTAYKKLVLKCHPDKVQDPTLKALKANEFQKVQQAYELLNDDAEKAKYEQKLRLAELQRAAKSQPEVKSSPNTSVPRTSTKYSAYDLKTAPEPTRYKSSPSTGKVYTYSTTTHTRSHEEMPSSRGYSLYEETDRQARRTASYEKPTKRDEEKREREKEERRRRREEDEFRLREKEREREKDRERERERERERAEREREARKAEKKRMEKDRKREAEEKARRHNKPYVEHYDAAYVEDILYEDEKYVLGRSEKKRSSSRKHDEGRERDRERDRERERERERDKSSSRRAKSPHVSSDQKHVDLYQQAASYMMKSGNSLPSQTQFWASQSPPDVTPLAPTPPPVDFEEESIRHASARAAGRRASNDPARSREKLKFEVVDVTPKSRPIPTLGKSYSTPPPVPESPPRISRSQTTPHEPYRSIPSLPRTQTWAPSGNTGLEYFDDPESDEGERERRRRRSRRTRSPSSQPIRYKVEGVKASKIEPQYAYGDSPSSARRYTADVLDGHVAHSPSSQSYSVPYRVKQTKHYGPDDVKYSEYGQPYYTSHGGEAYMATA